MVQENTNRAIFTNSIINYVKLGINTLLALFTTRFALKALGVEDFGLFSLLGSIISFIGLYNTIMVSTCNRFLAVAIGQNNDDEINKQFNVNLIIFIIAAIIMLIIAFPVGEWYINYKINYSGPVGNAKMVFYLTIIGSVVASLSTPYYGLLMAKENFIVFSLVDIFTHFIRLVVSVLLLFYFSNKLLIYSIAVSLTTILPTFVYWLYCKRHYFKYTQWHIVKEKKYYKNVFSFSGWVTYGALACVAKNQGAAIIVNAFFNTVMNTALGIANSLNTYVSTFANSLTQSIQPQITKNFTVGNIKRTDELLIMSTKFSFLLMLLVSTPFFVSAEWILSLWLGNVPEYAVSFTLLLIIDNLVLSFNSGLSTVLFASGRIAKYQFWVNTFRIVSIVVAFFIIKYSGKPEALFCTYIVFSFVIIIITQLCLKGDLGYDIKTILLKSYIPSLCVLCLLLPFIFCLKNFSPFVRVIISLFYLTLLIFLIGLSKKEKQFLLYRIKSVFRKR